MNSSSRPSTAVRSSVPATSRRDRDICSVRSTAGAALAAEPFVADRLVGRLARRLGVRARARARSSRARRRLARLLARPPKVAIDLTVPRGCATIAEPHRRRSSRHSPAASKPLPTFVARGRRLLGSRPRRPRPRRRRVGHVGRDPRRPTSSSAPRALVAQTRRPRPVPPGVRTRPGTCARGRQSRPTGSSVRVDLEDLAGGVEDDLQLAALGRGDHGGRAHRAVGGALRRRTGRWTSRAGRGAPGRGSCSDRTSAPTAANVCPCAGSAGREVS